LADHLVSSTQIHILAERRGDAYTFPAAGFSPFASQHQMLQGNVYPDAVPAVEVRKSMATLAEQLTVELADAMRAGDKRKRDVIRFLRAGIKNAEIERQRSLTDLEVQDVIRFQIKQRRDSIDLFRRGGRNDLADEEELQIALLLPYLPPQLDDEQLLAIVVRCADNLNAKSPKEMGLLMTAVLAEVDGRAERRRVSQVVRDELGRRAASFTG
jgi:hypothetical protein